MVGAGVATGLAGALALTGTLRSLLFGVEPADPITFGAVVAVVVLVALISCWIPTTDASRMEPTHSLREG